MLWFGTWEGGVNTYDRRLPRFFHYARQKHNTGGMISNAVKSIYEDKSGTLWVGTRPGLNKLAPADGGTAWAVTRYTSTQYPMSPDYNTVFSIFQDPDEFILVVSALRRRSAGFISRTLAHPIASTSRTN